LRNIIGFTEGHFLSKYLGLPLSAIYLKPRHFSSLINKFRSKLEGWSMHTLSFSGRVKLTKSVIYGIIGYWIQSFNFPISECVLIFCGKEECIHENGTHYVGQSLKVVWSRRKLKTLMRLLV